MKASPRNDHDHILCFPAATGLHFLIELVMMNKHNVVNYAKQQSISNVLTDSGHLNASSSAPVRSHLKWPWVFKTITPKWHTADNRDRKSSLAVSSGKCPREDWRTASCFPAVLGLQIVGLNLLLDRKPQTQNGDFIMQSKRQTKYQTITVNILLSKRKHHLLH